MAFQPLREGIEIVRKDVLLFIIGAAVVAAICFGISKYHPFSKPSVMASDNAGTTTADPAKASADSAKEIAHVNGEPITMAEFQAAYTSMTPEQQAQMQNEEGKKAVAERLVKIKLLAAEARKTGVDKDPVVAAQLRMVESEFLANAAAQKMQKAPTEPELHAEYEKNKGQLSAVTVRHILIAYAGGQAPPRSGQAPSIEQASAKANEIFQKLQGGADFAKVAHDVSDDAGSAARGGMLGPIRHGMLPPEIEWAVFDLNKGQISK
ncbi:MAG: peptidylprolyl isomerase, partial [Acidobacteria bacterium]|nr:peptidylprolyl isomerase [Acidobacteriota bacterium]